MDTFNITAVRKNECTGCGACFNKCPVKAIRMEYDNEGFINPIVDEDRCIQCEQCLLCCPVNNKKKYSGINKKYYALWTDVETRKSSSSGGMFSLLAEYVLEKKGVVCGCEYSDDFQRVYHVVIDRADDLEGLRKSKYVQSETGNTFTQVAHALKKGIWVLYVGTPCQIAGLKSFLGKDYENLITADLVCHGVPSVKAYQSWLKEKKQGKEVKEVNFRDKSIASWGTVEYIKFKDDSIYYEDCFNGTYYKAFLQGLDVRKSCSICDYSYQNRPGDFTLGDFWGVNEILGKINDGNGTSLVILNTEKANRIFENIKIEGQYIEVDEKSVIDLAKTRNGNLLHPTRSHYARKRFFELIDKKTFSNAVLDCLNARYDIGVVGWWYNLNYGGTLTYYALHQVLKEMGFEVLMIARTSEEPTYKPDTTSIPYRFALKHYNISRNWSRKEMSSLNEHCSAFISGSDQLFNPVLWQWSGPEYFLDFVNPQNKKISYASSFGNEFRNINDLSDKIEYWLNRFDAISVREDYGVEIAKNEFGIVAQKVLDPVFLCDVDEYVRLAADSKAIIPSNYVVNFILDPSDEKRKIIEYISTKLGKDYINLINADDIDANTKKLNMRNTMANADIEDWIKYYLNCDFVFTDSFHGTCFAIIFQKPFISFANMKRGEKRFISLLSEFDLMSRLVYSMDDVSKNEYLFEGVDYSYYNKIISEKRNASRRWLYNSIVEPQRKDLFKILNSKIWELEQKINRLESKE